MKNSDIKKLMALKGWNRARLASELELTENSVQQWFLGRRRPGGPAKVLMRLWLAEALEKNGHTEPASADS